MKILVTGSRKWPGWREWEIYQTLSQIVTGHLAKSQRAKVTIIHGDAGNGNIRTGGVDAMVRKWCELNTAYFQGRLIEKRMPADWDTCGPECRPEHRKTREDGSTYCPVAGHRRNQKMVDERPDVVYAFQVGGSTGTADCIARAKAAGIRVEEAK